jgi:hypothetical protein
MFAFDAEYTNPPADVQEVGLAIGQTTNIGVEFPLPRGGKPRIVVMAQRFCRVGVADFVSISEEYDKCISTHAGDLSDFYFTP